MSFPKVFFSCACQLWKLSYQNTKRQTIKKTFLHTHHPAGQTAKVAVLSFEGTALADWVARPGRDPWGRCGPTVLQVLRSSTSPGNAHFSSSRVGLESATSGHFPETLARSMWSLRRSLSSTTLSTDGESPDERIHTPHKKGRPWSDMIILTLNINSQILKYSISFLILVKVSSFVHML